MGSLIPRHLGMGVLEIVIYTMVEWYPLWYNVEFPLVYVREYRKILIRLLA
jgi:hypothetical protein